MNPLRVIRALILIIVVATACDVAALFVASCANAQTRAESYPSRAIRLVVPFPPGGPADIIARILGQKMTEDWGQAVIVENRSGANTVIGAQVVAKAAPDGYTLLIPIDSTLVMNQFLYRNPPYDPFTDFTPITTITKTVSVVAVRAADGPKSVAELIARAKAAPGKLNYGAGTITAQLMGHLFHTAAGLDIVYVPFKGTAETTQGLLSGNVDVIYAATLIVDPLIEAGETAGARKARPAHPGGARRSADACPSCEPSRSRRYLGLARSRRPCRHADADCGEARRQDRRHHERSGGRRTAGARRQLPDDDVAPRIRGFHAKGGGAVGEGAQGAQSALRLRPARRLLRR